MTARTVSDQLREAAQVLPRMRWFRSGATVEIPGTEDWAGTSLSITGLHRPVGRAYARHIAAASPANVMILLEQRDELLDACMAMIEWDDREQDHAVDFNARMDLCRAAFNKARAAIAKATGEQQ
ncbi:hypothetical protein [Bordetella trematum]|uniref:hypothetical protein n=1 Tax=Bordetella trematum TaxID=123899 RepID=UPI00047146EF|nr:hypothetical protein [Bordetella trematum]